MVPGLRSKKPIKALTRPTEANNIIEQLGSREGLQDVRPSNDAASPQGSKQLLQKTAIAAYYLP